MTARKVISDARAVAALPRVEVVLSRGADHEERLWRDFRRPHPRYRVIRRKAIGVALLDIAALRDRDDYLAKYPQARRMERKARAAGYVGRPFDPEAHRAELHAIHTSTGVRQGRPMDAAYLADSDAYKRFPGDVYLGVSQDDVIVAYLHLLVAGDVGIVSRHIGHAEHLNAGVMYMLTADAVARMKTHSPGAQFLMHDTFFGAPPGLRFFKAKNGFVPYRVRWTRDVSP